MLHLPEDTLGERGFLSTCILVSTLWLLPQVTHATTWYVEHDGSPLSAIIQEVIDQSASGDTIIVGPGTYYEVLDFRDKNLVFVSQQGPEATIIDGTGRFEAIISCTEGQDPSTKICGFTFQNGTGRDFDFETHGGALYCVDSYPTICHNRFLHNESTRGGAVWIGTRDDNPGGFVVEFRRNYFYMNIAEANGGALKITNTPVAVIDNAFVENATGFNGGGVDDRNKTSSVYSRNVFLGNYAGDKGGGLFTLSTRGVSYIELFDCVFSGNTAIGGHVLDQGSGGGIHVSNRMGTIRRNTIINNDGRSVTGAGGGGISLGYETSNLTIEHNILAFNLGSGISCYNLELAETIIAAPNIFWQNEQGAIGSLLQDCPTEWHEAVWEVDPQFCDWKNGDLTVATTSPAISTGAIYGAYPDPHCGIAVQTEQTTWGGLKVMFRSEN